MDIASISQPTSWTDSPGGYFLMFIAMVLGGPAVTSAGAFAAAFGVFNIWIVFLVSIISNLVPDALWYAIGFLGREHLIERLVKKYGRYFKVNNEKMEWLEKLYDDHVAKTLIFVKLVPLLATPGLIAAGVARVPIRKYASWSIIVTLPTSLIFLILGYYFGAAYERILHYYTAYGELFAIVILISFFIISYAYRKFTKKLATKIEHIE
ncbi:MAG: VTT domain-containing protein [Patescibacteria group bacterium]